MTRAVDMAGVPAVVLISVIALAGVTAPLGASLGADPAPGGIEWIADAKAPPWVVAAIREALPKSVEAALGGGASIGLVELDGDTAHKELIVAWTGPGYCGSGGCGVDILGWKDGRYAVIGVALGAGPDSVSLARSATAGWRDLDISGKSFAWTGARYDLRAASLPDDPATLRRKLLQAIRSRDPAALRTALAAGADPNARYEFGLTALHGAVLSANVEAIKSLIAAGADVNARGKAGTTPLFAAAALGFPGAVIIDYAPASNLIINSAHRQTKGLTGKQLAALEALQVRLAQALLDAGADPNIAGGNGETPLHIAAVRSPKLLRLLIKRGGKVDVQDKRGRTPLHVTAHASNGITAGILIDAGADRTILDDKYGTAAQVAIAAGDYSLVALLREGRVPLLSEPSNNVPPTLPINARRRFSAALIRAWHANTDEAYRRFLATGPPTNEAAEAKALLKTLEEISIRKVRNARGYQGRVTKIDAATDTITITFDHPVHIPPQFVNTTSLSPLAVFGFYPDPLRVGKVVELYGGMQKFGPRELWTTIHVRALN